jgi:protein tyrosine/serine phosphatase
VTDTTAVRAQPFADAAGLPAVGPADQQDHDRHVLLELAFNVRDLGGLPGDAGRLVRSGVLYRGDGIHRAGPADEAAFQALGLRTVLDLRTDGELAGHGAFAGRGVVHHHLPVLRETWEARMFDPAAGHDEVVAFLTARYVEMLEQGPEAFAAAIRAIADPANQALLFHCAAGKDRTGVLAFLVLGLLGVSDDDMADDYHLTQHGTARWLAWTEATEPAVLEAMADQPAAYLASPRDAAFAFFDELRTRYGSAEAYVAGIGVDETTVDRLRTTLLA